MYLTDIRQHLLRLGFQTLDLATSLISRPRSLQVGTALVIFFLYSASNSVLQDKTVHYCHIASLTCLKSPFLYGTRTQQYSKLGSTTQQSEARLQAFYLWIILPSTSWNRITPPLTTAPHGEFLIKSKGLDNDQRKMNETGCVFICLRYFRLINTY